MFRKHIINKLIEKNNYQSYVEIGVRKGWTFRKIDCPRKIGVDPDARPDVTHIMTSDEFFMINKESFDIFFIDGLHEKIQVLRDIENALHFLNDGGTVVIHDMSPATKEMQEVPRTQVEWTGNGWKAWMFLRQTREDLMMHVIDTDYGVGIIQKGKQKTLPKNLKLNYESLDKNRKKWLNLISEEEFLRIYT